MTAGGPARVHVAVADAWEVEGRVRERDGGGALEVRGLRLMASGLKPAQWNGGDVTAPDADLEAARAFYAQRGADWGVRVPVGMPWRRGRRVLTLDLMTLRPEDFPPVHASDRIAVRVAGPTDLDAVVAIDAAAFEEDPAEDRPWIAPHLEAGEITTVLATLDGEPAGTGYAIRTDGRGGPALLVAGVGVHPDARRRGVAAALSSWLVERGLASGAGLVHLHADTEDAARVYARLGFVRAPGLDVYVDL